MIVRGWDDLCVIWCEQGRNALLTQPGLKADGSGEGRDSGVGAMEDKGRSLC